MARAGVIHEPADDYGRASKFSEAVRRDGLGYGWTAHCRCGWRGWRRYRAVVERDLRQHLSVGR